MAARKTSPKQTASEAPENKTAALTNDTAPDDEKAEEEAEAVLVVTAPRERRRAGIAFGREPVRLRLSQLSDEQMLAIESDPLLSVRQEQA